MAKKYKLSESERKSRRKYEKRRRERIKAAGFKELRLTVHPEDEQRVRGFVRRLFEMRMEGENA